MKGYILLGLILIAQHNYAEKLDIKILYESLCPDSVNFIANQLCPNYKDIAKYVNITFVPFGKSYSNKETFECQHGPQECQGNRVQSCVFMLLESQDKQVEYANCFMTNYWKSPGEYGQNCAKQVGVVWKQVKECYESQMGTELQLDAEKITNVYNPSFIPTIVYNDKFDQEAQDDSIYDFRSYICNRLKKTYPDACPAIQMEPVSI